MLHCHSWHARFAPLPTLLGVSGALVESRDLRTASQATALRIQVPNRDQLPTRHRLQIAEELCRVMRVANLSADFCQLTLVNRRHGVFLHALPPSSVDVTVMLGQERQKLVYDISCFRSQLLDGDVATSVHVQGCPQLLYVPSIPDCPACLAEVLKGALPSSELVQTMSPSAHQSAISSYQQCLKLLNSVNDMLWHAHTAIVCQLRPLNQTLSLPQLLLEARFLPLLERHVLAFCSVGYHTGT
mmetsp:Transcript_43173/g.78513  ORF Transcript_43173/g.78513 Transcript_43173/m.78513 type:complete len:243 (-) Transcript_43173:362-1090(-)